MLATGNITLEIDKWVKADISNMSLENRVFTRLVAKRKKFINTKFCYSIFENSYLRGCAFDSCDFTGVKFLGCNLYESTFIGCKFDYCVFERTIVDSEILNTNCPPYENLKLRFARTLRMNFQQLGDAKSVNKAIGVELIATKIHLNKSVWSNEAYYRKKYHGLLRIRMFLEWIEFNALEFIWGNGESALKLIRAVAILLIFMAAIDIYFWKPIDKISSYFSSLESSPEVFLGIITPDYYPKGYLTSIVFARLITMGFFLSIVIKRFNRR